MAHKKSLFILILAFILMALVTSGCEKSYAPIDESLATPTVDGAAFPEELPADMAGVFEAGAQTATAQALAAGAEPVVATEVPADAADTTAGTEGTETELAPETEEPAAETDTATEEPVAEETEAPATSTPPVLDPTATPIPSVDTGNLPSTYILQKGEFPYCIARRFNVNPNELLSASGISSAAANALQPGLTLTIPKTGNPFPYDRARNDHPVTYVVPESTSVYAIACFFGDVDPAQIVSLNGITDPNTVAAGTSLQIP